LKRHIGLTLLIAGPSLALALILPDIAVVFSVMGGTATAFVCFIMPAAIAWRLRDRIQLTRTKGGRMACLLLMAAGAIVGLVSTITTIIGLFSAPEPPPNACSTNRSLADSMLATSAARYIIQN
jgi:amino acid permease